MKPVSEQTTLRILEWIKNRYADNNNAHDEMSFLIEDLRILNCDNIDEFGYHLLRIKDEKLISDIKAYDPLDVFDVESGQYNPDRPDLFPGLYVIKINKDFNKKYQSIIDKYYDIIKNPIILPSQFKNLIQYEKTSDSYGKLIFSDSPPMIFDTLRRVNLINLFYSESTRIFTAPEIIELMREIDPNIDSEIIRHTVVNINKRVYKHTKKKYNHIILIGKSGKEFNSPKNYIWRPSCEQK